MKVAFRIALAAVFLFALTLTPITARAIDVVSNTNVTIPADKTIEDDLAAGGSTIDIAGRINGNLYAGGSNIVVTGPITGSLHTAGSELTLNGPVGDDLWAAGGTLTVHSTVAHNMGLAGGTVTLASESTTGRDALVAGNLAVVDGAVGHNLTIYATTATVSSHVQGYVEAHVESLTLTASAIVDHDLTVYAPHPPEIAPGAQIKGTIHYHPTARVERETPFHKFYSWLSGWLSNAVSVLVLGFVLLYLFPHPIVRFTEILGRQAGKSLLFGSVAFIAVPLGIIVTTVSLVGFPLALCMGAAYMIALLIAVVPCAYLAGITLSRLLPNLNRNSNRWLSLALGSLLLTFITSLPYIGGVAGGLLLTMGSGAILISFRDQFQASRNR